MDKLKISDFNMDELYKTTLLEFLYSVSKRSFVTRVRIDDEEYAFSADEPEELDRLIKEKRNEIIAKKRDEKIKNITDEI